MGCGLVAQADALHCLAYCNHLQYLKYRSLRSARELLCYSKGEVQSADSERSLSTAPAAATTLNESTTPVARHTSLQSKPKQDGQYSKELEQQLSATRQLLRQATSALEHAKTEREKLAAQVRKTATEMQTMKADLVDAKAQLQKVSVEAEQNAAAVAESNASLTAIQDEVVGIKALLQSKNSEKNAEGRQLEVARLETEEHNTGLIDTIKGELADIKEQLQTVSSKADRNTAAVTASEALVAKTIEDAKDQLQTATSKSAQHAAIVTESNTRHIDTIKVDLADIKHELRTVSAKEDQNTARVKACQDAMVHLKGTAQLLLKLLLERTRDLKE